jgi:hypothetical protein
MEPPHPAEDQPVVGIVEPPFVVPFRARAEEVPPDIGDHAVLFVAGLFDLLLRRAGGEQQED